MKRNFDLINNDLHKTLEENKEYKNLTEEFGNIFSYLYQKLDNDDKKKLLEMDELSIQLSNLELENLYEFIS